MERIPSSEPLQGLSQLPEDVLWTILGYLDLLTLYSARLVCKRFRKTAAGHFKTLGVDCTTLQEFPTTDFTQFSGTSYLGVTISHECHLQSLVHPRLAPIVTHVSLKGFRLRDVELAEKIEAVLARLPKLRSVSVQPSWRRVRGGERSLQGSGVGQGISMEGRGMGRGRSAQGRGGGRGRPVHPEGGDPQRVEAGEIPAGEGGAPGPTVQPLEGDLQRAGAEVVEICPGRGQGKGPASSAHPIVGKSHLLLFPPGLEELKIADPDREHLGRRAGVGDASPLTRCFRLTCLEIELRAGAEPSIGSLASLRNLRSLYLCSCPSALGVLSTFTVLTGLTFEEKCSREGGSIFPDLGRLTGLSRLALRVLTPEAVTHVDIACLGQLTNLTCLEISGYALNYCVPWSTALLSLTRLVSLRIPAIGMPRFYNTQVEALQSLTLTGVRNCPILAWATGLTHLDVSTAVCGVWWVDLPHLWPAVAGMTRLRSLEVSFRGSLEAWHFRDSYYAGFRLYEVLRACTMLTKLVYRGWIVSPDRELKACASLPGLRSLSFACIRELTPACLPALQAMSGLTELSLLHTGIRAADIKPDVIAAFVAKRRQLGWPLLKLRVEGRKGRCCERLEL